MLWLSIALASSVHEAFPPPAGAQRVPSDAFGTWLGQLQLAPADQPVRTHDGRVVRHRARVIELDLVPGDLQQCADSVMRLRAEWLRGTGHEDDVMFHATSGDPMPYTRWKQGERPVERGNRLAWVPGTSGGWEAYLGKVFTWAGTRSLAAYDTVQASGPPVPGDLLVAPGSPGHAVVLLDVAKAGDRTWVLVAEGYMPAQDLHVELGPDAGWWPWEPGVTLSHWDLSVKGAGTAVHRRFKDTGQAPRR